MKLLHNNTQCTVGTKAAGLGGPAAQQQTIHCKIKPPARSTEFSSSLCPGQARFLTCSTEQKHTDDYKCSALFPPRCKFGTRLVLANLPQEHCAAQQNSMQNSMHTGQSCVEACPLYLCKLVDLVAGHDQVLCAIVQVASALLQSLSQVLGLLRDLSCPLLCLISVLPELLQLGYQPLHLDTNRGVKC